MVTVKALVVAGGGGGGSDSRTGAHYNGGGGGAGGLLYDASFTVTAQAYTITVGDGGDGSNSGDGSKGEDSVFSTMTSIGGALGGGFANDGGDGGCGGGHGRDGGVGGDGTSGQGYDATTYTNSSGGAGTGATNNQLIGGAGTSNSITGSAVYYGGGGGGTGSSSGSGGAGGIGGGGAGVNARDNPGNAGDGTANTGGGGGGCGVGYYGGDGGSGIVIISYITADFGNCTGGTKTTDGSNTVHTFTSNGTFTVVLEKKFIATALALSTTDEYPTLITTVPGGPLALTLSLLAPMPIAPLPFRNTVGTTLINKNYPNVEGLIAGTTKQTGNPNLVAIEGDRSW